MYVNHCCLNFSEDLNWTRKIFCACNPICLCIEHRNYQIHLKFGKNFYLLRKISCIIFKCTSHEPHMYSDTQKYLCTLRPMEENKFVFFLSVCGVKAVAEIISLTWNLTQIFMCYDKSDVQFLVYIALIKWIHGY